jgi:hypothetical protein
MRRVLGGRGLVTHLECLRVFVYLAGGFVVIERVPEDQTQIFVDFQRVRVGACLEFIRNAIERPGLGNDLLLDMVEGIDRQGEGGVT